MNFQAEGRPPRATEHGPERTSPRTSCAPRLDPDGRWLVVPLLQPHTVTGWTLVGGDLIAATEVAWRFVAQGELPANRDARAWLKSELCARFSGSVNRPCFLTARRLEHFEEAVAKVAGVRVRVVATVGLSNALAAGDAPGELTAHRRIGTINVLVIADRPVSAAARLEALSIAAEAKALALFEGGVKSQLAAGVGRPATGTGTDCALVAGPHQGQRSAPMITSAGKHTAFGSAVGAAVFEAVNAGARAWLKSFGGHQG